jgi:hypothetical protein
VKRRFVPHRPGSVRTGAGEIAPKSFIAQAPLDISIAGLLIFRLQFVSLANRSVFLTFPSETILCHPEIH